MNTATLSARGQIVIPAAVRRAAKFRPGDRLTIIIGENDGEIRIRRQESLDEIADRLSRYAKPGIEPLLDVHEFYNQREPRV
ncbi:MAG: AbrB/MazE/SpoVT family DNA-binding domain-containing protein [Propionibacteriaceae bacterium]|nr:AbrB/MazE/SpoVT family DNA-binding domain-containing protein [Propionibacteriaceae bacterium]